MFCRARREISTGFSPKSVELARFSAVEFFQQVLRENLSILNFVDSKFVVIDERLASHQTYFADCKFFIERSALNETTCARVTDESIEQIMYRTRA